MKSKLRRFSMLAICGLALLIFSVAAAPNPDAQDAQKVRVIHNQVIVPGEDRFSPFAQTIHAGEAVRFMNMDTDDHTVVSVDAFNTAGNRKVNILLKGTDNNGGNPGTLVLHFGHPGTFVYYCRFHAHLDDSNQPVAPGPKQGIQDPDGNYGTPMMGIITVVP
jgi:plastocyanin